MILRLFAAIFLVYAFGFLGFAVTLPSPAGKTETDAVIVLTGGPGRIARGLEVIERGWAKEMFVSGVDPEVKPGEFAEEFEVPSRTMNCCVTLGQLAVDTRSNAGETAQWIEDKEIESVRLVTTDWHMARAYSEVAGMLPAGTAIIRDAVGSHPDLGTLFLEYNKLIASEISQGLPEDEDQPAAEQATGEGEEAADDPAS
ncbi:YdcF family protein [Qipengyuania sphaerica]|uniref:YdcF family protein n=1 Tax=Qipengyuania sphaerica TaxID=2867243 RepID=UPI001C8836F7|nr:YdcF family protein [Qipengyuania sphaerica]MBX7541699.1 YdcF family protein [Qipengyuania sphaerica]